MLENIPSTLPWRGNMASVSCEDKYEKNNEIKGEKF
jgi:hypothetical protein